MSYNRDHLSTWSLTHRLPELQEELQKGIQSTEDRLRDLPQAPSSDTLSEILNMLDKFCLDLGTHLKGTPSANGLLQQIRPTHIQFRKDISATAPEFRPYSNPHTAIAVVHDQGVSGLESDRQTSSATRHTHHQPLELLSDGHTSSDDTNAIYLEEVLEHADR